MRRLVVCSTLLFLFGCEQPTVDTDKAAMKKVVTDDIAQVNNKAKNQTNSLVKSPETEKQAVHYQVIEWTELIPQTDLDALLNPPEYIMDVEDGSIEDQIVSKKKSVIIAEQDEENNYERALTSTNIIEAMDGKNIEIPGFIVPIAFNEEQVVTSFFLVPYFGACLHMPPPPPNQIIYIEIENGFPLEAFYDPVVVSGKLSVVLFEDQIATSAYSMTMDKIRMYYENE
jgi:uncharacterized protein